MDAERDQASRRRYERAAKQLLRGPVERDEPADLDVEQPTTVAQSQELWVTVATALREHGIGPGLLELELTESTLMLHAAKTVKLLHRLKANGTRISIDDLAPATRAWRI